MLPILTIALPFPEIPTLKVHASVEQNHDLIYPIELGYDIFIMKWNCRDKWRCNGIYDAEVIATIGSYIESRSREGLYKNCRPVNERQEDF